MGGLVAFVCGIRKRCTIITYLAVGLAGAAAALKVGEKDRNTAICTNNRSLSYIHDSSHGTSPPQSYCTSASAFLRSSPGRVVWAWQSVEASIAAVVLSSIGLLAAAFLPHTNLDVDRLHLIASTTPIGM